MAKAMEYDYLDDIEYLDDIPRTAREVFPADKLARDIERYLAGALEQLRVVELNIAGDDDPRNEYKDHYGPDYEIGYVFEIIRASRGVHAVLSETRDLWFICIIERNRGIILAMATYFFSFYVEYWTHHYTTIRDS